MAGVMVQLIAHSLNINEVKITEYEPLSRSNLAGVVILFQKLTLFVRITVFSFISVLNFVFKKPIFQSSKQLELKLLGDL